jgi:hypothetical protein
LICSISRALAKNGFPTFSQRAPNAITGVLALVREWARMASASSSGRSSAKNRFPLEFGDAAAKPGPELG